MALVVLAWPRGDGTQEKWSTGKGDQYIKADKVQNSQHRKVTKHCSPCMWKSFVVTCRCPSLVNVSFPYKRR